MNIFNKLRIRAVPLQAHEWRNRILLALLVGVVSGGFGEFYQALIYGEQGAGFYRGFRTGFCIGFFSVIFEVLHMGTFRRNCIQRFGFIPGLIIRILMLTLIIRVSLVGNDYLTDYFLGMPLKIEGSISQQLRDTGVSMLLVVLFVSYTQLLNMIGFKRFINIVSGRYFHAVVEERVFLFVDLVGSSQLARKLGDVRFHEFLSEFFYHVDFAIVRTGGEIVSYVGDAVIVTWPLGDNHKKNGQCLRAIDIMLQQIERQKHIFEREFGEMPKFRGALHGGPVVVGECGDSRKQVTFLGDAVNMTARIEEASKKEKQDFLISDYLAQRLAPPKGVHLTPFAQMVFKGAEEPFLMHRVEFSNLRASMQSNKDVQAEKFTQANILAHGKDIVSE